MTVSSDEIARRTDALRRARVDSQIEGQHAHLEDAAALDAWARGEIDGDELTRRVLARAQAANGKRRKTAA